jgi:hypothetical protein
MICPECNGEMVTGELRLHRSHISRVIFSPVGVESGGVMASVGPKFVKVSEGQSEVAFSGPRGATRVAHQDAHRCPKCRLLIVEDA